MLNNVTLLGRLTAAPEIKVTTSGTPVTSFCLAVDRRFLSKDGKKQTDFLNCVAWQQTAEFICKNFSKGDALAIVGEIQTRKYTDRDNNNRIAVEIVVNQASFAGGSRNNAEQQNTAPMSSGVYSATREEFEEMSNDDDLPF